MAAARSLIREGEYSHIFMFHIRCKEIFAYQKWKPIENTIKKRQITMTFRALKKQSSEYNNAENFVH